MKQAMTLSRDQMNAVTLPEGPAMIIAGPGSGKTLVLTHRITYLIQQMHVRPEHILVITFSRAAAKQMKDRFLAEEGANISSSGKGYVRFGTFHSLFFQILRQSYHLSGDCIVAENRKMQFLTERARGVAASGEDVRELAASLNLEISYVKNEQISLDNYYPACCGKEQFVRIFGEYDSWLRKHGQMDYDDIQTYCQKLLSKRGDILAFWQNQFRYILIDEFQDINRLQYDIVRMLALPRNNLMIVGDDDQAIYHFRGSRPEIMLGFPRDYPGTKTIVLSENFRCSGPIMSWALEVITQNEKRFAKQLKGSGEGSEEPTIIRYADKQAQAAGIISEIRNARSQGMPYRDMAILTRTNAGLRYLLEKLSQFQIPVSLRGSIPCLYDHWIAQDVCAYLRAAGQRPGRSDFLQIINRPMRYISRECMESEQLTIAHMRQWYEGNTWIQQKLDQLKAQLDMLSLMRPYAAVNYIRYGIEYQQFLESYALSRRISLSDLTGVMDELQESARPFETTKEWMDWMEECRRDWKNICEQKDPEEDAVILCTYHSAKGLEYTRVFLPDVSEQVLPHKKAQTAAEIEEERRLFYVGMTRARRYLQISYVGKPSPFLSALPPQKNTV